MNNEIFALHLGELFSKLSVLIGAVVTDTSKIDIENYIAKTIIYFVTSDPSDRPRYDLGGILLSEGFDHDEIRDIKHDIISTISEEFRRSNIHIDKIDGNYDVLNRAFVLRELGSATMNFTRISTEEWIKQMQSKWII